MNRRTASLTMGRNFSGILVSLFLTGGIATAAKVPDIADAGVVVKSVTGTEAIPFAFVEEGEALRLTESGTPVLAYRFGMTLKEGVPEDRRRSCYIHPVYDLDGRVITDDFPEDHHHHRGMAWMWPGVWIGDARVDEWHIKGIHQRFVRWLGREVGPVEAVFGVEAGWFLDDGSRKADERAWYRVSRAGDEGRAIDVHYTLRALDEPLRIQGTLAQEKGYGGFCFRFAPREDTVITTDRGREKEDSDRLPSPWADLSARFEGSEEFSGVAVFIHPGNPGYPNGWTLRHYGFLGVAWPGLETVSLAPGESFSLQYRVWIHRGTVEDGGVAEAWSEYLKNRDRAYFRW